MVDFADGGAAGPESEPSPHADVGKDAAMAVPIDGTRTARRWRRAAHAPSVASRHVIATNAVTLGSDDDASDRAVVGCGFDPRMNAGTAKRVASRDDPAVAHRGLRRAYNSIVMNTLYGSSM
jgi:hypothetical protein